MNAITIVSSSMVKPKRISCQEFITSLVREIESWPDRIDIAVFPEYCWGNCSEDFIIDEIRTLQKQNFFKFPIVFGTIARKRAHDTYTNSAIVVLNNKEVEYIDKISVLTPEQNSRNVRTGSNSGVIKTRKFSFSIVVCADLWNFELVKSLTIDQNADILLVPSFTAVPKGYGDYAREQWYSLAITRSRELIIPIAIADHKVTKSDYDVGDVSLIVDPSIKIDTIKKNKDLLYLPSGISLIKTINLDDINEYKKYRENMGIYRYNK